MRARTIVSINLIVEAASAAFDVSPMMMLSASRRQSFVRARDAAALLATELTLHSSPSIGRHLGERDHSTILQSIERAQALCGTDHEFAAKVNAARIAVLAIARSSIGQHFASIDAIAVAERICADPDRQAMRISTGEVIALANRLLDMSDVSGATHQLLATLDEFTALKADIAQRPHRVFLAKRIRAIADSLSSALAALGYGQQSEQQQETAQ